MPTELYGTLYSHNNLPLLCTMLKDIYAKKPQPAAATAATTTPPYRIPKLHPHNYYQADQIKSSNSLEEEKQDLYPWLDKDAPIEP